VDVKKRELDAVRNVDA
jgi:U3 small nucleolar RNA-associated protein 14